jgi:hypothetical protein
MKRPFAVRALQAFGLSLLVLGPALGVVLAAAALVAGERFGGAALPLFLGPTVGGCFVGGVLYLLCRVEEHLDRLANGGTR